MFTHMPMDNFRSLFWRPYAFIYPFFTVSRSLMNRLFRNEGDILGVQSPFHLQIHATDGFPSIKRTLSPTNCRGIEFFVIKRSCEEGHSSIVLSNAPFPRERSGGEFSKAGNSPSFGATDTFCGSLCSCLWERKKI